MGLWIVHIATFCINRVTLSVPCTSVPACLACLIDQKLPQCTLTCRPLSEVTGALLSAIFLRGGHRGFVCRRSLQLSLCLTLFSGKNPATNNRLLHTANREVEKRLWISRLVASNSCGAGLVGPHGNALHTSRE